MPGKQNAYETKRPKASTPKGSRPPRPTRILREIPCGTDARATEAAIHQLLRADRLRGEWFTHHSADHLAQLTDEQVRALAHQPA